MRTYRVGPNVFGIPFGVCGLAQCWATAHAVSGTPRWPADTLWVIAAGVWLAVLLWYGRNVVRGGRLRTELNDPVFGPFVALIAIVPMFLGVALAGHARTAGEVVFGVALVLTVAVGGWLSGTWIIADLQLAQWHPGYFLPTVGGGLIAAGGSAALGHRTLAMVMFGYGVICWLILGTIVLLRLFTAPPLPVPLRPTIAIELAPPVVAGNAWFLLNGGRVDAVAAGLAGYAILMVLVQLTLIPVYRGVPFGPGWWAFSFSYAAAFTLAVNWLVAGRVPGRTAWTVVLGVVLTLGIAALAARTVRRLARGTFMPAASAVPPAVPVMAHRGER
ncbi:TDT family transporter [Actinoplanes solisilvae]|uniref:SLAC1 family transporter n=1 Tax=Actinoplanes solisilvae TaxID=2486853 RepID=UPI0013E29295|nr:TDT family transporter [Actinoplanes solisilvae]